MPAFFRFLSPVLRPYRRFFSIAVLAALILSACTGAALQGLSTPIPTEYLPTVIALTLQANPTPAVSGPVTPAPVETAGAPATGTQVGEPGDADTGSPPLPAQVTAGFNLLFSPPPPTQPPPIPEATIQIYKIGDMSKIISPVRISGYLRPGSVGPLLLELHGEDGRVLVRQVKDYTPHPRTWVEFVVDIEFEIAGATETGRLVVSTLDEFGRTKALNSVNLILLSSGENDINPPSALYESLVIKEPAAKSLIAGETVLVSGLARTYSDQPLMGQLIGEDGKILGTRLLSLSEPDANGYRTFTGEVPYKVPALTSVRLIVYENGGTLSDVAHLSSLEVLLTP